MAEKPVDRTHQPHDQPLNAGLTLVELVVSIAIIGTLGLGVAVLMVQMSDTFIGTQTLSLEHAQYQIALEQIAKEIAQCLPATLTIGDGDRSLQCETIVTGGVAAKVKDGELIDRNNSQLGRVIPGMLVIFRPEDASPVRLEITGVDRNLGLIRATGLSDSLPREYWIVRPAIAYTFSEGTVIRTEPATGISAILCEGIADFQVTTQPDHAVRLSMSGTSSATGEGWVRQKLVVLP